MWDPRFPQLAAVRLQEAVLQAASEHDRPVTPGPVRRRVGAALMALGERLAAPGPAVGGRPAAITR